MMNYTFSTFQELFDRVPSDRIEDCCAEIGRALSQGKQAIELSLAMAKSMGEIIPSDTTSLAKLPSSFDWHDDGNGEITTNSQGEGQEIELSVISKMKGA